LYPIVSFLVFVMFLSPPVLSDSRDFDAYRVRTGPGRDIKGE
jgi:hypothetical protein